MPAERVAQTDLYDLPLAMGTVSQDRDDQLRQVDAIEAVRFLVEQYGAARVARWVSHVAAQRGEAL